MISDLTRVSRSTKDLLDIIDKITSRGAKIKSLKDFWLDTTSTNPYSNFLLVIMSALSQLERDLISTRIKEGLAAGKARGRNGGRPKIRNKKADIVKMLYQNDYKINKISEETGLSRATVYRILKENNYFKKWLC